MRSLEEIIVATESGLSFPEAVIAISADEELKKTEEIREMMRARLHVLRETADAALAGRWMPKLVADDKEKYKKCAHEPLSGRLVWRASEIATALGTCNASMGRIVAAPTAGSCGIMPGLLLAWGEHNAERLGDSLEDTLLEGLAVAAGVGDVVAHRATLAGAAGGCQAECGVAAAMGGAALCHMEGGSPEACAHTVAIALKSILGLACDPVAGLVEAPCVKRNASLVSLGAISADMALCGIRSIIPPDEVIDAMGDVGRALPPSLRETARGGCAVTPSAKKMTAELLERVRNSTPGE